MGEPASPTATYVHEITQDDAGTTLILTCDIPSHCTDGNMKQRIIVSGDAPADPTAVPVETTPAPVETTAAPVDPTPTVTPPTPTATPPTPPSAATTHAQVKIAAGLLGF